MAVDPAWPRRKLEDLVLADSPICYGVLKPGPETPGGVPLVRIVDLEDDVVAPLRTLYRISRGLDQVFARSRLLGGEVLLSIQGTVGRVALAPEWLRDANISRTIARVAIGGGADSRFVRHWLLSNEGQKTLDDCVLGTTRDSLNIGALRLVKIPAPGLPEQRRIAEILDAADEAIRATEAVIAKAAAVRDALAGDLLRGRGVSAPQVRLADVITLMRNGTAASQSSEATPFPVSRIETISSGEIDWSRVGFLRRPEPEYVMRAGDILYSHINSMAHMGKVALFPGGGGLLHHGMNLMLIRPDQKKVIPAFLAVVLSSPEARAHARREAKPAINQASLGQDQIGALSFRLPPLTEQNRVVAALDTASARVRGEAACLAKLKLQKQGMMQDLLTGRVRVTA